MLTFFVPWPSPSSSLRQRSVPVTFDRRCLCVPWWRHSIVIFTLDFIDVNARTTRVLAFTAPTQLTLPRLMIIQSMTRWVEVESHYFDTVISINPSLLPVLLGLVKEIALYITVLRCGLKAIYWSGCFDLTWSWSHDTHLFHCCTFSSLEHDYTMVKWDVVGRHSSILSFLLI